MRQSHDLTRDVPDAYGLVQRGRGHQILSGMELGTHHIVVVPRQDTGQREREGNDTCNTVCSRTILLAKIQTW